MSENKPKYKYPHFAVRIPREKINKLRYIANCNSRSANKEIEVLVTEHIKAFEQKHGEITSQNLDDFFDK